MIWPIVLLGMFRLIGTLTPMVSEVKPGVGRVECLMIGGRLVSRLFVVVVLAVLAVGRKEVMLCVVVGLLGAVA